MLIRRRNAGDILNESQEYKLLLVDEIAYAGHHNSENEVVDQQAYPRTASRTFVCKECENVKPINQLSTEYNRTICYECERQLKSEEVF